MKVKRQYTQQSFMTITFDVILFSAFEELRLIKAQHVICMTVRKELNRRFDVLTIEAVN